MGVRLLWLVMRARVFGHVPPVVPGGARGAGERPSLLLGGMCCGAVRKTSFPWVRVLGYQSQGGLV